MQSRPTREKKKIIHPQESVPKQRATNLEAAIASARAALQQDQQADGHWVYTLEADCTIPAEYILMMHFMDEVDRDLERKIAIYLRKQQASHGGWPLYQGGEIDLSGSVKVYYALKLAGDDPATPHMVKARKAILAHGGAARTNV
ncbi:MAG TPA: prenyltransferase/squalene oxidase repeat-containing protein, partial [Gammaproteobacteria bacterium]|nr:prenyltransferase/squalene oxidase repeat-containing protein [Gammaproteobacteria bacterium]